jgi:membrane carboxypeptidase/penicillin-binding protein
MSHTTRVVTLDRSRRTRRARHGGASKGSSWRWPILGTVAAAGLLVVGFTGLLGAATFGAMSVGLPDPQHLADIGFAQPTIVYDRSGTVELGRFQDERRRVIAFADVPTVVLDATTAAEDRTF